MSKQSKDDLVVAGIIVAILLGLLAASIPIILSNLDIATKGIGIIAIVLIVYVIWNEFDKRVFLKLHPK